MILKTQFGFIIAVLLMVNVGFQVYDFILRMTEPFYYHSVKLVNAEVRRGGLLEMRVDVQRFRICKVVVDRFMASEDGDVFFRESVPAGATKIGRNVAINKLKIPTDAPLGEVILFQNVNSHCIEGMHSMPWPVLKFKVVE